MKQSRQCTALILAALLTLSLTACGGRQGAKGQNADAQVAAAREKLTAAASMNATYSTAIKYTAEEEEAVNTAVTTVELTVFSTPKLRVKGEVTLRAGDQTGEQELRPMTLYLEEGEAGQCTQYLTDGTAWVKGSIAKERVGEYNFPARLDGYLAAATAFRAEGTEPVGERDAAKLVGQLGGKALVELLESGGALKSVSAMSPQQQEKIKTDLEQLPPLSITLWVDAQSGNPVRCEMDLTKTYADTAACISKTLGGYDWKDLDGIESAVVSMTCSDFGAAEDFVLPEAARTATDAGKAE